MKIAVYSGSFNPLHKGHEAIIRFLTLEAGFDKVYLVVTPQNPLVWDACMKVRSIDIGIFLFTSAQPTQAVS